MIKLILAQCRSCLPIFFHVELRENLTRVGANLKQGFIEAVRSTWATINQFARSHRNEESLDMDDGDVTDAAVIKPMQNYEGENKESFEDRGQGLLVKVVLFNDIIGLT